MELFSAAHLSILTGLLSLSYIIFGLYIFRKYRSVGSGSLSAFSILWGINFLITSAVIFVLSDYGIQDGGELARVIQSLPDNVQLLMISSTPLTGLFTVAGIVAWLWFVLRYTRRIQRQQKIALIALGGILVVVTTFNQLLGALVTFGIVVVDESLRGGFHRFASVVEVLGTGVSVGSGIALLYTTSQQHRPFKKGAVVGLSIPILFPWLARFLYQFALIIDFQVITFLRGGSLLAGLIGLWVAVHRYDLFEQLPASRTVGRQAAFDASETAIVVVNNESSIADLNPAARELFNVTDGTVIGNSFRSILPEGIDEADIRQSGSMTFQLPNSDTVVEAKTTTTEDSSGRAIGETMVFTDITEERRRQQRIQVLNRVLRHNLRNDITAAKGYLDLIGNGNPESDQYKEKVTKILQDLVRTGDKARDTEKILAVDPVTDENHSLREIVADVCSEIQDENPDLSVEIDIPSSTAVRFNPIIFRSVLSELLENAARHTDDSEVTIRYDPEQMMLTVSDTGSGIPQHEIDVLYEAEETSLHHGSGLGLWLVKWGTDMIGGSVRFETDGSGTEVQIVVPPTLVSTDESKQTV